MKAQTKKYGVVKWQGLKLRMIFTLDGEPFKILSGAIHYFRIPEEDWYHSLYNLKALGFNTVETYVVWNLHEPTGRKLQFWRQS